MRDYNSHLKRMQGSGVNWVRMDVKKPISQIEPVFQEAHDLGLSVIAVITSKKIL